MTRTFKDSIFGHHVPQAIHGSSESSMSQPIVWAIQPAPKIFVNIMCFVESSLVDRAGVSDFRVKKGLSQITGGLETLVEAAEMHQDPCRRVRVRNKYVHMFNEGCHPERSDVL
jgi:hypothetical protein